MNLKRFKLPKFTAPKLNHQVVKKASWAGLMAVAMAGAFYWGRHGGSELRGQSPQLTPLQMLQGQLGSGDHGHSPVAYINGNIPISREELGEYLIERVGAERLEFLVNRRLIERACEARNIHITEAEINAQFAEDCKTFGCTEASFVQTVLRPKGKTLFEWREDVIRQRLAMQRFVKDDIVVSEEDIQKGFEAKFGPKRDCRIYVVTKEQAHQRMDIWTKANSCKTVEDFERFAKDQPMAQFASTAGKIDPIGKHFGSVTIEEAAFKLQPGEVSPLIFVDDSYIILFCVKHVEPDPKNTINAVREQIFREAFEAKVTQAIPEAFKKIREAARPQLFIRPVAMMAPNPMLTAPQPSMTSPTPPPSPPPAPVTELPGAPPETEPLVGPPAPLPEPSVPLQLPGFPARSEAPAPPMEVFPNRGKN